MWYIIYFKKCEIVEVTPEMRLIEKIPFFFKSFSCFFISLFSCSKRSLFAQSSVVSTSPEVACTRFRARLFACNICFVSSDCAGASIDLTAFRIAIFGVTISDSVCDSFSGQPQLVGLFYPRLSLWTVDRAQ